MTKHRQRFQSIGALKQHLHLQAPHLEDRHHPCVARGTSSKNTKPCKWNRRTPKIRRTPTRFVQLRIFKSRFQIA